MRLWVVILGLAVSACASSPGIIDTGRVKVTDATSLPVPSREDLTPDLRPHVIGPFDELNVSVYGIPDLSREKIRVDTGGQIVLPLVGVVDAGGKTPAELTQILETRLRARGVREPQVSVLTTDTISQTVTVDGEVRVPGIYPIVGRMTLLRAVARAQGTTENAQARHVVVFRKVQGREWAALYDMRAIRQAAYEDPQLYPNDLVVVGDSEARRLVPTLVQMAGALLNPLVLLVR
jgi:polysaccharide biosynthesis/export protein